MPKRKVDSDEESSEDEPITTTKSKKSKTKAAEKQAATVKKPKVEKPAEQSESEEAESSESSEPALVGPKIHQNAEGESYIDLGKKKRATVRSFKGMALLDIREFWGDAGAEKPGKKGISLNMEQWKSLKAAVDALDKLMAKESKS